MIIIIDGNAFLNVSVSIVKNILSNNPAIGSSYFVPDIMDDSKFMLKQLSKHKFKEFTESYLTNIILPYKNIIDNIIFVFDSKSWRKRYIREHIESDKDEEFEYKGKRKYDDHIYLFFEYFQNEVLPNLSESCNIQQLKVDGAEGDDLIAYLCEYFTDDICIWTVDKDLIQLVDSGSRSIILSMPKQMTKTKKIYTSLNFDLLDKPMQTESIDLFDIDIRGIDNSTISNIVKTLINKDFIQIRIDPGNVVLTKCLGGDSSDSIPRIHTKMTPGKILKIVETFTNIIEPTPILEYLDNNFNEFINIITPEIVSSLKLKDQSEIDSTIKNLKRNFKLIRLNSKVFPSDLYDSIKESIVSTTFSKFNLSKFKKNI